MASAFGTHLGSTLTSFPCSWVVLITSALQGLQQKKNGMLPPPQKHGVLSHLTSDLCLKSSWWSIKMVNTCPELNISGVKCIIYVIQTNTKATKNKKGKNRNYLLKQILHAHQQNLKFGPCMVVSYLGLFVLGFSFISFQGTFITCKAIWFICWIVSHIWADICVNQQFPFCSLVTY